MSLSPSVSHLRPQVYSGEARNAPTTPSQQVPVIDRTKVNPETVAAAEGMEAMFLDYMFKVMRESVPKSEMSLDSPASDIYRSMLDSEVAQKAARAGGVGLSDQIIAYLETRRYNQFQGVNPAQAYGGAQATGQAVQMSPEESPNSGRTGGTKP